MDVLLPLFVLIPLSGAVLALLGSRAVKWSGDLFALSALAALVVLAIRAIGSTALYSMGGWTGPLGIQLRLDGFSSLLLLAINIVGFCLALFSVSYMRLYTAKGNFYALFLLLVAGLNGAVLSSDLFNIYICMELVAVSGYALVAFGCDHEELEASFKYYVLSGVASSFILLAMTLLYTMTGTLNLAALADKIGTMEQSVPLLFVCALLICGFGLKAAFVPFHAWLPDAHPCAPAPVSAMLSGIVIKSIGIYVLVRLIFNVFGAPAILLNIVCWLGIISMITGAVLSIGQWDMKRLFAYSTVSQIGYIALGVGLGTQLGIVGGLYHLINHSTIKPLLFLTAGSVEYSNGTRDLKKLGGLNKTMPVTSGASLIASLSIAGVPPFNGFWSKLIIIIACIASGHYLFAVIAVAVAMVTLGIVLKVQKYAFFDALKSTIDTFRKTPLTMAVAMLILSALCLGLSLLVINGFHSPYLIGDAANVLLRGRAGLGL